MCTFEAQEPTEATHKNVGRRNGSIEQHRFTKMVSALALWDVTGAKSLSERG